MKKPPAAVMVPRGRARPDRIPDNASDAPAGYPWSAYVDHLVSAHKTLAAVAERLAEAQGYRHDAASIERALRRLRAREAQDGGVWGRRALSVFGLPDEPLSRARWMGTYHSRFTDLPVHACESLLRAHDAGPLREPPARPWIQLGFATVALRRRELDHAADRLAQCKLSLAGAHPAARVEHALTEAFVASRAADPARVQSCLDLAERALDEHAARIEPDERQCLRARLVDQRAFVLNREANERSLALAASLYESLPSEGAPAFALCRRENGLAYARMREGRTLEAIAHAERSARAAGDAGALRLRAMALLMLVKIKGRIHGASERARAEQIARTLADHELLSRATA
jgi:hypothetical protein